MLMKIHANHLAPVTKNKLQRRIGDISNWKFTNHALENIQQREISFDELSWAVAKGHIIEYHTKKGTSRVLLKDDGGTCAVVDLDKEAVITAYKNNVEDKAFDVDSTQYIFGV